MILHTGPNTMTSVPNEFTAVATITDLSGISEATLTYSVDGGAAAELLPDQVVGDEYTFIIPQQEAGAHVEYFISATDNNNNSGNTATHHYVSGTVVFYDDNDPEFIYQYAAGNKVATRFTPIEPAVLVTGMLRLYTDTNRPLDYVDVEVWSDALGFPGASIVGPLEVYPQSDLEHPQAWTYVDFRGMGVDFAADEDFHLGYTYRSQWPVILGDSPAVTGRSSQNLGPGWVAATTDYHIRAILAYNYGACCDEDTGICTETYASQCDYTFTLGADCSEVDCGGGGYPCGHYVVGDYNGSEVFNIADVIAAFSKLQTGSPDASNLCECPPGGGIIFAIAMDVNGNCAFNLADVIAAFSKLQTGSPDLVNCPTCPPAPFPSPDGGDRPLVNPNLESRAKISGNSGMQ